ncbi:MAG: hypothetical protein LBJ47_12020 [Tannerella sp.]|jgi:hypothetical protein|nr:hypothetical protein [Tannerella sp.]
MSGNTNSANLIVLLPHHDGTVPGMTSARGWGKSPRTAHRECPQKNVLHEALKMNDCIPVKPAGADVAGNLRFPDLRMKTQDVKSGIFSLFCLSGNYPKRFSD